MFPFIIVKIYRRRSVQITFLSLIFGVTVVARFDCSARFWRFELKNSSRQNINSSRNQCPFVADELLTKKKKKEAKYTVVKKKDKEIRNKRRSPAVVFAILELIFVLARTFFSSDFFA